MQLQKYIFPIFVTANLLGQNDSKLFPEINLGLTHSVYSSMCMKSSLSKANLFSDQVVHQNKYKTTELQYGFGLGLFLWMPLSEKIVFKPKMEIYFSNVYLKQKQATFSTSFDLSISHGFVITLKQPDTDGIIYIARNMSCYLQSKQPYLVLGPKINLKKCDKGYLQKGYENEISFGFIIGYGINYIFRGVNVAPEITYGISFTSQNQIDGSKKIAHTITLALNVF